MIIIIKNTYSKLYIQSIKILFRFVILQKYDMTRKIIFETLPQTHSNGLKGNEGNICSKMRNLLPAEQASSLLLPADFGADL